MQRGGSALIVYGSGFTKFDECGSGSRKIKSPNWFQTIQAKFLGSNLKIKIIKKNRIFVGLTMLFSSFYTSGSGPT